MALGFTREAIAGSGPFSLVATLAGITLGGWLVARIGVGRALLWTGSAQTVAMGMYEVLAHAPGQVPVLYLTVATEAFAQGMADAAFLTFLSGLCSREFTATHYALLSSIPALAIHTIGGVSGGVGGCRPVGLAFYAICTFAALPAMGFQMIVLRRSGIRPNHRAHATAGELASARYSSRRSESPPSQPPAPEPAMCPNRRQ